MIEISLDSNSYVDSYNLTPETSTLANSIKYDGDIDLEHLELYSTFYKYANGVLKFDEDYYNKSHIQNEKETIRKRRETECFSMVDRSKFWYDSLSAKQLEELKAWYEAWLDAPETSVIPEPLPWLEA